MATSRRINKTNEQRFIRTLKNASDDKSVEVEVIAPAYREVINLFFQDDGEWDFYENTDGFYSAPDNLFFSLRLLLEAKFDFDLRNLNDRARIIAQCVYYMKRFVSSGHDLPNVILAGDRDQMFAVYAPPLKKYLDRDYDWSLSPSAAPKGEPGLVAELEADTLLATYVWDINDSSFSINEVMMAVDTLAQNDGEYDKIKIYPQNIRAVFDSFLTMLKLKNPTQQEFEEAVTLFITSIVGGVNAPRLDSKRKDVVHLSNGKTMKVDGTAYQAFFSRYETDYRDDEIDAINGMYDVLIEEVSRRYSGDFWTPTIWTDQAHRMLEEAFGDDWRRNWVVWDPACGTKNLTRDFADFNELYLSTLHQFELDTSTIYNPDAEAFQFDFLNDDIGISPDARLFDDWKLPTALFRALVEKRPILFLMNPPYATSTNQDETSKKGVAKNAVNSQMVKVKGYKAATQQLYTQFLYRIMRLKEVFDLPEVAIGIFSNDRFMTGAKSWGPFMEDFQDHFEFESGMYFNAAEFANVKPNWGISFTVWKTRKDPNSIRNIFPLTVWENTEHGLQQIGERTIEGKSGDLLLSEWLREAHPLRSQTKKAEPYVRLKNALSVYGGNVPPGSLTETAFGYLHNNSDSVEHSSKYVGFYSTAFGSGHGIPVTAQNFERAAVVFAARKSTAPSANAVWITGHDNYQRPSADFNSDEWKRFVADSVIYSIANRSGSNQSSLRKIDYKGDQLNVFNEFFFLSRDEIEKLAVEHGNRDVRIDVKTYGKSERFVYEWIRAHQSELSPEANELYEALKRLNRETFAYRSDPANAEEFHLGAWDAGFWQMYLVADKEDLPVKADYLEKFANLEETIRKRTHDFGILPLTHVEGEAL